MIFWALIAIAGSVALLAGLDTVFFISNRRKSKNSDQSIELNEEEKARGRELELSESQRQANAIIADATTKARAMFAQAEIAGIKRTADIRLDDRKLHSKYEHELQALGEELQKHLAEIGEHGSKTVLAIERRVADLSAGYEKFLKEQMERIDAELKVTSKKHLQSVQSMLVSMERDTASKVAEAVERELSTSRSEVAAYRAGRQRMVDDHIVDILERTAMVTFSEALTLQQHSRLIYRALEQAKQELFFDRRKL